MVLAERFKVHSCREKFDPFDRLTIAGVLEDNDSVLCGAVLHLIFEEAAIGEIYGGIQYSGEAKLKADEIEQTQAFRSIEVGDQIHVRIGSGFTTGDGTMQS
jgi:hypothetical protein